MPTDDKRLAPMYTPAEAARLTKAPLRSLRAAAKRRGGGLSFVDLIEAALRVEPGREQEVERAPDGSPIRWRPKAGQGLIVIDPRFGLGAPVVDGAGIRTGNIADRARAGESDADLAEDFGLTVNQVEIARRFEALLDLADILRKLRDRPGVAKLTDDEAMQLAVDEIHKMRRGE